MNNKSIIRYMIVFIVMFIIIITCIKIYKKDNTNSEENNNTPPASIVENGYVEYKRFKFKLPENMEYTTDEYKIHIKEPEKWVADIDPIVDQSGFIKNNLEKMGELLKGYIISEGPISRNTSKNSYFYYKVVYDGVNKILAYMYFDPEYVFEIEYEGLNEENDDLVIIDLIVDSISSSTYDDSKEKKYLFHAIKLD